MAFKPVGNKYLKIDSSRQANWYYHHISRNSRVQQWEFSDNPQRKAESVIHHLDYFSATESEIEDYVNNMKGLYKRNLLQDEELSWIKKTDKRLIFCLWAYLKYNLQRVVNLHTTEFLSDIELPDVSLSVLPIRHLTNYKTTFNYTATNNNERYDAIIYALDVNPLTYSRKKEFISQFRTYWLELTINVPKLNWLLNKPEEARKAFEHLHKMSKSNKNNRLTIPLRLELANLSDPMEVAQAIQAILDFYYTDFLHSISEMAKQQSPQTSPPHQLLLISRNTTKELAAKMRKAFDERKSRERKRSEKSRNLTLSAKAQNTVVLVAMLKKQKEMKIIETLLEEELNNLKSKPDFSHLW